MSCKTAAIHITVPGFFGNTVVIFEMDFQQVEKKYKWALRAYKDT